jgi:hypothetical protein
LFPFYFLKNASARTCESSNPYGPTEHEVKVQGQKMKKKQAIGKQRAALVAKTSVLFF